MTCNVTYIISINLKLFSTSKNFFLEFVIRNHTCSNPAPLEGGAWCGPDQLQVESETQTCLPIPCSKKTSSAARIVEGWVYREGRAGQSTGRREG
jgi:hypothetical protein